MDLKHPEQSAAAHASSRGDQKAGLTAEALALALGTVLALVSLAVYYGGESTDFEQAAFGEAKDAPRASVDGHFVHCDGFRLQADIEIGKAIADLDDCITGARKRAAPQVGLWLGNSQVHAVNQHQPGQESAPGPLHDRMAKLGLDLLTVSYPNADQQEHLVTYSYVAAQLPVHTLVLSLVFDDFRETGIRDRLQRATRHPGAREVLASTEFGQQLLQEVSRAAASSPGQASAPASLMERSESFLEAFLSAHSPIWASRPEARGQLFTGLYELRNLLFGITPNTVRNVIPTRYTKNRAAVEALLVDAARRGVTVIGYIAPLRSDIKVPYNEGEYLRFIEDMRRLFAQQRATLVNLEDLVPGELWGHLGSDDDAVVDFMHFQAGGHRLIEDALATAIAESLGKP